MQLLDDLDRKIILALEQDARISLKQLAQELDIKTSTIYHRLHRLQESNVLKGFTVILNPEFLNIEKHVLLIISLKNLLVKNLDSMFVNSFGKFLDEQFPESMLISIGEDNKIYLYSAHRSTEDFEDFLARLKEIPYVEGVEIRNFQNMIKGNRLYRFSNLEQTEKQGNKKEENEKEELEELETLQEH
ncbi:MAG: Lrp/AsnC family transcriptional regulator [Candidatus Hodarchaeota archaeon]